MCDGQDNIRNNSVSIFQFFIQKMILVCPVVLVALAARVVRMGPLVLLTLLAQSDQLLLVAQLVQLALLVRLVPLRR